MVYRRVRRKYNQLYVFLIVKKKIKRLISMSQFQMFYYKSFAFTYYVH